MAKGYSLSVGINKYGPNFPNATELFGCENDARTMHDIALNQKFERCRTLLGPDATLDSVFTEILDAACKLQGGDIFFFTFAGHGTQVDDRNQPNEPDETILLYDFMVIDDVLETSLLSQFKSGVRVLMVADSCHSGTVSDFLAEALGDIRETERISLGDLEMSVTTELRVDGIRQRKVRTISETTKLQHLAEHAAFYDRMLSNLPSPAPPIAASVLLLAACEDNEDAGDTPFHGVFTDGLIRVWNGGKFAGNYGEFRPAIADAISPAPQHPVLTPTGQANPTFLAQRPFSI